MKLRKFGTKYKQFIYESINNSLTIGPIYFMWCNLSWLACYANDRPLHNTHYIQLEQQ
jgi:hypothetical protein